MLSTFAKFPHLKQAIFQAQQKAVKVAAANEFARRLTSIPQQEEIKDKTTAAEQNWKKRCELAACYRILRNLNFHEGICNHLSASCPASDGSGKIMLLVPYGLDWSEVTASSLAGVSLKDPKNPKVIENGAGDPDISALSIHNGIHHKRPDMSCVLHAHMPNVTALTCLKDPTLYMLHQNSTRFFGQLCYDTQYDGAASCVEEGFRLGEILKDKTVMMMGNHGVLVLGKTVAKAFDKLYYLERAAEVQILAYSTGKELSIIPEELILQNQELLGEESNCGYEDAHFDAMRRLIAKEDPKYET